MNKILYLEIDEEITSVIDRISKVDADAVALVVPRGGSIIQGIVSLKLLKKEADKLGKKVTLITTDKSAKNLASQVGIDIFDNLNDLPEPTDEIELSKIDPIPLRVEEKSNKKIDVSSVSSIALRKMPEEDLGQTSKQKSYLKPSGSKFNWKFALGTFVFLLLLGGFTAFYLLPKAEVKLVLNSENYDDTIRVKVDKSLKKYSQEENAIPGQVMTITKSIEKDGTASGKKDVGEPATGTLTFRNSKGVDQTYSAGTIFTSTNGLKFKIESGTTIPKAFLNAAGDKVLGSTTINASAIENGDKYNITSQSFKSSDSKITIVGSQMKGGFSKQITVVSKKDIDKVNEEIDKSVDVSIQEEIAQKVSGDSGYVKEAVSRETIKNEVNPKLDNEAKEFKVTTDVKVTFMVYKNSDMNKIVDENIQKTIENKVYLENSQKEIVTKIVKNDIKNGIMFLDLDVKTQVAPKLDEKVLRQNLTGKSQDESINYLKEFKEVNDASVTFWPFWVKKIPGIENSVKINLEYVKKQEE